ncbi:trypsin-like peptidase domain-containing protein [Sphingomonas sp. AR_OL41]|uniref:S1C family serine protease n=1 Tax=Sphingomonas sp. AR_OL41 TaxID=3042729 RepID=UPI0024806FD2|nr:trypsin-like peptidase domain-containing protein [Sphingomonas sp. AR_OL41]MDH7975002.1 trypsin-like peptidase domain-containing protein [Sphingomonas sp. AR_OL41]
MKIDRASLMVVAVASLVALTLLVAGAIFGAYAGPRVVRVEQHVVAPAMNAAGFTPAIENLADMIGQNCPAIVTIQQDGRPPAKTAKGNAAPDHKKPTAAAARPLAGFLVSNDGYIVTSADAISDQGDIHVLLNDGRILDAIRAGTDPISGIGMLKIEGAGLPFLKLASSNFPRVGEWVVAVASPRGSGCTAAIGTISSDSIAQGDRLRTFVSVRPVLDSALVGAPLLGANGEVVGIVGLGSQDSDPDRSSSVLPAGSAGHIVSEMLRNGKPADNRFGIVADDLLPALAARLGVDGQRGAVISLIDADSAADRSGLQAGDLILAVSGTPVSGASELARALDTSDDSLSLDIVRMSKRLTVSLAASPSDKQ